jgi:SMODS and SLOG-associating 2TM effector domain 1
MAERDRKVLDLYLTHRVQHQIDTFYKPRRTEYLAAYRQSLVAKAVLLALGGVAGILAGINLSGLRPVWSVFAAALPAVSTALAAYDGLFSFDRLAKVYGDVVTAVALLDQPTDAEVVANGSVLTNYVTAAETIFLNEQGQWGQLTRETPLVAPQPPKE